MSRSRWTDLAGNRFDADFKPDLLPPEMLKLGVFDGHYAGEEWRAEFPPEWFATPRVATAPDPSLNCFGVHASQPLAVWQKKGWIAPQDPLGWFQWYCRYTMGRRSADDDRQILRWRAMRRHLAQLRTACKRGDLSCRPRQRQALLHWGYDSRKV